LLKEGLADELSILLSPHIIGKSKMNLFRTLEADIDLKLISSKVYDEDYIHVIYEILQKGDL
jgi:2,5-diamino-6-(ribosylamino)-4(3H)-pyrimidinone 5'-phosphate reductase